MDQNVRIDVTVASGPERSLQKCEKSLDIIHIFFIKNRGNYLLLHGLGGHEGQGKGQSGGTESHFLWNSLNNCYLPLGRSDVTAGACLIFGTITQKVTYKF